MARIRVLLEETSAPCWLASHGWLTTDESRAIDVPHEEAEEHLAKLHRTAVGLHAEIVEHG